MTIQWMRRVINIPTMIKLKLKVFGENQVSRRKRRNAWSEEAQSRYNGSRGREWRKCWSWTNHSWDVPRSNESQWIRLELNSCSELDFQVSPREERQLDNVQYDRISSQSAASWKSQWKGLKGRSREQNREHVQFIERLVWLLSRADLYFIIEGSKSHLKAVKGERSLNWEMKRNQSVKLKSAWRIGCYTI